MTIELKCHCGAEVIIRYGHDAFGPYERNITERETADRVVDGFIATHGSCSRQEVSIDAGS